MALQPDLVPQSVTLSSSSLTAGGTETVTVVVKNQGSATAGATTTMIRLNQNPTSSSTSDPQVAVSTPAIAAGGTATVSASFTIATAGTYYAHTYVDNFSVLSQSNTSNDKANSGPISVTAATFPDLVPQSVTLSSSSLTAGGTETVTVVVKNQGSAAAGATTTMIRLNQDPNNSSTSDPQVAVSTPAIAAGGTATVSASFTIATAGTYYAHTYVDNFSALTQSNTGNDKANSGPISVTAATFPDLVPQSVTLSSSSLTAGGTETVTVVVKNQGSAAAGATTTMIRLNQDPNNSSTSDPQVAVSTPAIAAGGTATVNASFTIATAGTYYAHTYVDNFSALTQSNTGNDKANSGPISVSVPSVDSVPDTPATANSFLTLEQSRQGTVNAAGQDSQPGDRDVYKVILAAGHTYTFSANANVSTVDTLDQAFIRVYGPNGNQLSPDLTAGGTATPLLTTPVIPGSGGTYYVAISADGIGNSWKTKTGDYTILVHDNGAPSPTATTLNTTAVQVGTTAEEVAKIAEANLGDVWAADGCAAFVWGVTNLAGLPFFDLNDKTTNHDPRAPQNVAYVVPHSVGKYSGISDVSGDGWYLVSSTASVSQLLTILQRGDVVRVYKTGNTSEDSGTSTALAHSFVVASNVGGDVQVIDNWSGGVISRHALTDITNSWAPNGQFAAAFVSRIDSNWAASHVSQSTLQANGFGNWSSLGTPQPTAYTVTATPVPVTEADGATVTFTITRTGSNLPQETLYASTVQNQGPVNQGDYATNINDFAVPFAAGVPTATVTLAIGNDSTPEQDEKFGLIVQKNKTDPITTFVADTTFTIHDDDTGPVTTYEVKASPDPAIEGPGATVTLTITREGNDLVAETVYVSTVDRGIYATNTGDYTNIAFKPVMFLAGATSATSTVPIAITNDGTPEPSESYGVIVQRTAAANGTTLARTNFTIQDDDRSSVPSNGNVPGQLLRGLDTNRFGPDYGTSLSQEQVLASLLAGDGYKFAAQYIGVHTGSISYEQRNAKGNNARADIFKNEGIQIVTIYENQDMSDTDQHTNGVSTTYLQKFNLNTAGNGKTTAYNFGYDRAQRAYDLASSPTDEVIDPAVTTGNAGDIHPATYGLAQPFGTVIYFGIDFYTGTSDDTLLRAVQDFFRGVQQYFGEQQQSTGHSYQVGVYGAAATLARVMGQDAASQGDKLAAYSWLSTSWADPISYKETGGWNIWQPTVALHDAGHVVDNFRNTGVTIDTDFASSSFFGGWSPGDAVVSSAGNQVQTLVGGGTTSKLTITGGSVGTNFSVSAQGGNVIVTSTDTGKQVLEAIQFGKMAFSGVQSLIVGAMNGTDLTHDTIYFSGADGGSQLEAGASDVSIVASGGSGDDMFSGGSAGDVLDGASGTDTVIYDGLRSNYLLTRLPDGSLRVADLRSGSPDGTDTLSNVELLQFADIKTAPPIETSGSTSLTEFSNRIYLQSGDGSGPQLKFLGTPVAADQFGTWVPLGVEAAAGGYQIAWKNGGNDQYVIWNTDGAGNFVSQGPLLTGAMYALQSLESTLAQDLNSDGTTGPVAATIEAFTSTDLKQVADTYFLYGHGTVTGPQLKRSNAAVTVGQFGAWTPIGAEQTANGTYLLVWKNGGADQYVIWNVDSAGNFQSQGPLLAGTAYAVQSLEAPFGQDLNGDGATGPGVTTIEAFASTDLKQVGDTFFLYAHGTATGPQLKMSGAAVTAGQFGAWTPIGAEQAADGTYRAVWKNGGADQYIVWNVDGAGSWLSQGNMLSGASSELQALEPGFNQDFNGGGIATRTVIEAAGATMLANVANTFVVSPTGSALGVQLRMAGAAVAVGQFGAWTPIGAEQAAGGTYQVVWKNGGADQYIVWSVDGAGNWLSQTGVLSGASAGLLALEPGFNQDFNGGGIATRTVIEATGSTTLANVANTFVLSPTGSGLGVQLKMSGAAVTAGQFGAWTPIGAEQAANGTFLAVWKNGGADQYLTWTVDGTGNWLSQGAVASGASSRLQQYEPFLHQDLNGDGVIPIEAFGTTRLVQVGNNFALDPMVALGGPLLKDSGAAVTAGQYGAWTPIAVEQTATGFGVAWKNGAADQYLVWNADSSGNRFSQTGVMAGGDVALKGFESSFQQDLNNDGVTGIPALASQDMSLFAQYVASAFATSGGEASGGVLNDQSSFEPILVRPLV